MIWLALLAAQAAASPPETAQGAKIFAQSCSVGYCHGAAGAAGRGPRLRGRSFRRDYLLRVIREGIPNSAMPGWKGRLTDDQIFAVVDYIGSLGTVTQEDTPEPATAPSSHRDTLPPAVGRGRQIFFDAVREISCGTCHQLGGRGIAIGPDLAAPEPSKVRVVTVRLVNGEAFPAVHIGQTGNYVKLYDLTVPPPVLRTLESREVQSLAPDSSWRHDRFLQDLSAAERADIDAFLRWTKANAR